MKEFGWKKKWQNYSYENLEFFPQICIDSAFVGRSTSTTAFDGAIWYFAYTM